MALDFFAIYSITMIVAYSGIRSGASGKTSNVSQDLRWSRTYRMQADGVACTGSRLLVRKSKGVGGFRPPQGSRLCCPIANPEWTSATHRHPRSPGLATVSSGTKFPFYWVTYFLMNPTLLCDLFSWWIPLISWLTYSLVNPPPIYDLFYDEFPLFRGWLIP